jgi:cytoskeleton protein RodZ
MSTFAADVNTVAAAPRVGADLCAARQRLGWSLEDMAAGLRIRMPFLTALEEGRIADLPGNAYAIGFLRTYATALGLDPDELTRRFRAEAADVNQLTALSFPAPVPSRGVPAGAVVLLGVVLAVGAYVGWYHLSGNGELPPEVVPPVPARLAPLAERAVPPAPIPPSGSAPSASMSSASMSSASMSSASVSSAARQSASGQSISGQPASTALGSGPAASASTVDASATTPTDTAALAEPAPAPSVSPSQAAAATVPPAAPQPRVVLSATADAWMQVRDKSGQVLLNRVLHPGEFWAVPAQGSLVLTTGNAGGTDILVDGTTLPPLGASGAVRHDIPLDADLLKAGKAPSASLPMTTASSGPLGAPSPSGAPRSGSQ